MSTIIVASRNADRFVRARFVATVFAGSFLLFLVQPMVARMALPRVGGAPAVWNSAMLVYQALLLAGYAYAHWLGRLAPRLQATVHSVLIALAGLTLPLSLISEAPGPNANIFLWVPWLLLVSVGPLFLVISAQAPLMQRWFSVAGEGDPYPLYAASNLGSFLGLLTYPLILEPLLTVQTQSMIWSIGYVALALCVVGCALTLPQTTVKPVVALTAPAAPKPTSGAVMRWITLSAIPSGLMLSTTLHITTDIVAMPLLWVLPLGLYLLSYSVAFAGGRRSASVISRGAPLALLIATSVMFTKLPSLPLFVATATLIALFVIAVTLHSMLFDCRPDPAHLTVFYLCTSVGGVLGGLFCALIAPLTFDWTFEHPLLLVAAAAVISPVNPMTRMSEFWDDSERARRTTRWLIFVVILLSLLGNGGFGLGINASLALLSSIAIIAIAIAAIGNRILFAVAAAALMLSLGGWVKIGLSNSGMMTRSFFGILTVGTGNDARTLVQGTTVHGIQLLGSAERERMTTTYYAPRSGVGLAMSALPAIFSDARVGVVGLGAGTLGCASAPGQTWTFYEIDPEVAEIAWKDFHFLSRCQPSARIVIGDARLSLERAPVNSADILVVDAFSSDSIPMHLLTLEAFEVYRNHLSAEGLLLVHISNRYLDLRPVVAAAAAQGWVARSRRYEPNLSEKKQQATASLWIALSKSAATVAALERSSEKHAWEELRADATTAWTDDHASILPLIRWKD